MPSARFERLLAGTAVALALTLTPFGFPSFAATENETSAAVPAPDVPDFPPPTVKDFEPAMKAAPAKEEAKPAPTGSETTASVPASESPKATALSIADGAIADKLREQLGNGKFDRILGGKKDRAGVESFYASRDFAPLWITDGAINERGKAATSYLAGVDADGLDPNDYPVPTFAAGAAPEALAEVEIKFTDAVLTFARHAMGGRVHFTRVSGDISYDLARPDPTNALTRIANAKDVRAALDSFNPPQPQYQALKAKLAELRHGNQVAAQPDANKPEPVSIRIPDGKILREGMSDPRVIALRKRFNVEGDKNSQVYDEAVINAVKTFQTENDITVDGMLGPQTVRLMNGDKPVPRRPSIDPIDVVLANMERWRWVPRDLGQTYVMVNIPDFTLRVVRDGKLVWKTKIVVGKPNLPTPMLSAEMKYITVNPTWNVPPSIIEKEYLPALQQDPQAMERIGLKVEQNPDGTVRIWQPPGDRNALGRIRFNFPNKFLVYQHDTPDKYLFAKETRAYSHGCMRVENPLKYGEVLLSLVMPNERYTEERLHKMFGGSEININLPHFIPVHLTYQTAFVDDSGKLVIRDDIYGRDAKLLSIMKGAERKVADVAIDRPRNTSAVPVRLPPGTFGNSYGSSGPSFFERLFGGPEPAAPRPGARVGRAGDRHNLR